MSTMEPITLTTFSDESFLAHIVAVNAEFKKRFGKELGITGAYGEVNCAILWGMTRAQSHTQRGFDATINGVRIEVKCGVSREAQDTTSAISGHPFDKLLYVHYDDNYRITESYVLSSEEVEQVLSNKKKRVLTLREIRRFGKQVKPGESTLS